MVNFLCLKKGVMKLPRVVRITTSQPQAFWYNDLLTDESKVQLFGRLTLRHLVVFVDISYLCEQYSY